MLHKRIFPQLNGRWTSIGLNYWAGTVFGGLKGLEIPNPLLDPSYCEMFVNAIHKHKECDYSCGGYLEDRSILWRGHYMKDHIHYGIDYNVPVGTAVHIPVDAKIYSTTDEVDQNGGWGGKMTFRRDDGILIVFAHLNPRKMRKKDKYKAGEIIGYVGGGNENGGWYPHLHVQCLNMSLIYLHQIAIDGYGPESELLRDAYPDPEIILRSNS